MSTNSKSINESEISDDIKKPSLIDKNQKDESNERKEIVEETFINQKTKNLIFIHLFILNIFSNLDEGIIPAASENIQNYMNISATDYGLFCTIDYIGRLCGSVLYTYIISKMNRKYIMIVTLICKALCLLIPLFTKSYIPNLIFRAIVGIPQIYYLIYPPIWCDQYGNHSNKTWWISLNLLALPLGVSIGFGFHTFYSKWEIDLLCQAIILVIIAIITIFLPNIYYLSDVTIGEKGEIIKNKDITKKDSNELTFSEKFKKLITLPIYWFTGIASSVYIFSIGINQFWGGEYIIKVFGVSSVEKFIIYLVTSVISSVIGIIVGGFVGTKLGGYTKKICYILCVCCVSLTAVFSTIVPLLSNKIGYSILQWLYMFFVSSAGPIIIGLIIQSLPLELKGDGFSWMNFVINLIGGLPSCYIFGILVDQTGSIQKALMICNLINWIAVISICLATYFRYKIPDDKDDEPKLQIELEKMGEDTNNSNINN